MQFNIERGYKLDDVIAELLKEDAQEPLDVIALQEVDIGCERSAGEDTGMHAFIYAASHLYTLPPALTVISTLCAHAWDPARLHKYACCVFKQPL